MTTGTAIKRLRKSNNQRQGDFAKSCGMTQSYLSLIESDKRKPSLQTLETISDNLGIPLPIIFWFSIEESDVVDSKIEAYRILKPTIDEMIKSLI